MPTYEVPVANELLPEVLDEQNPRRPEQWRVVEVVDAAFDFARDVALVRVVDDTAPGWTDGKLLEPTISAEYTAGGGVVRAWVSEYREIARTIKVGSLDEAVREAQSHPGATVEVVEDGREITR